MFSKNWLIVNLYTNGETIGHLLHLLHIESLPDNNLALGGCWPHCVLLSDRWMDIGHLFMLIDLSRFIGLVMVILKAIIE